MTTTSIGDLARTLVMQGGVNRAKADVNRLAAQMASSLHQDMAKAVRGDLGPLVGIDAALTRLAAWKDNSDVMRTRLTVVQSSLGAFNALAEAQSQSLLRAGSDETQRWTGQAALEAADHLDAALDLLNARVGEISVFSGTMTDGAAVADADTLLDALVPVVTGLTTPEAVMSALTAWFADPAGFDAQIYKGGPAAPPVQVAQAETIALGVTATDPALKDALAALAATALITRGLFDASPSAQRDLAFLSGEALASNVIDRVETAARVGITEARLARSEAHTAAETTALGIARNMIATADPYTTMTDLEQAEYQLNLLHILTTRLSGLRLSEYLR